MGEGAAHAQMISEIAQGYLEKARATPSSWPFRALLGLAGLWLVANLARLFSGPALSQTTAALLASAVHAFLTWAGIVIIRRSRGGISRPRRLEALMLALFNGGSAIVASAFFLRLYLDFGTVFMAAPAWVPAAGLIGYFGVGLLALLYAPRSWPSTQLQRDQAVDREHAWAPYIIGLPAAGVSVGTALGSLLLHYSTSWEWPVLSGLSLLIACLILGFSSIGLYRAWLFARASLSS